MTARHIFILILFLASQALLTRPAHAAESSPLSPSDVSAMRQALTAGPWSWKVHAPHPDPWDERRFSADGTATAWRRGVLMCTGKWEVTGLRTVRIQNVTPQKNVHLLVLSSTLDSFQGTDLKGNNHYSGSLKQASQPAPVVVGKARPAPLVLDPARPLLETFSQLAPNATEWSLAPLDEEVPPNVRQNLIYLREDLLDEHKQKPKSGVKAYKAAHQLCTAMIAALDERDLTLVRAGYRSAQADAGQKVSTQALDARRNYMMSWPQYQREESQRAALRQQQGAEADIKKEGIKVEWAARTTTLRASLDALYAQFRAALRR